MKEQVKKIEKLEKELAELKAEFEKSQQPEKWQDKLVQPKESNYYFIASSLREGLQVANNRGMGRKPEHAFATAEQAELIKEKMLLMQEMYAFAHVRNEGWLPDWEDSNQVKRGIIMFQEECEIESYFSINGFIFGIAVKSKEIAEEMIEIFGERLIKYYNKQY